MNLESLYFEVQKIIDQVNFHTLWRGFSPNKFALYNDVKCVYNGILIDKPEQFIGNTAILYEGEFVAIWHVMAPMDSTTLATKIIHEMFHAFQNIRGESRFPNEFEALSRYRYDAANLSLKYEENQMLLELMDNFSLETYSNFLTYRTFRRKNHPYEYWYEASVEEIEGSAQYVELRALKQLDRKLYNERIQRLKERILKAEDVFPIRVKCYDVGALFFQVLKENHLLDFEDCTDSLSADAVLSDKQVCDIEINLNKAIVKGLEDHKTATLERIQRVLDEGELIETGELELLGVNVYDARYAKGYILSTHFVYYRKDDNEKVAYGDFLIQLDGQNRGEKIYKI